MTGSTRASLSLDAILGTAVSIQDADGTDALTFRRLARDLGAGVASLYWHVDSKEALLELALDRVLGEIPPVAPARAPNSWDSDLRELGADLYRLLLAHRWAAALMLLSSNRGQNALGLWERVASALEAAGFSAADALDGLSLLLNHILASGVQETSRDRTGSLTATQRARAMRQVSDGLRSLDPERFPTIVASADVFETHDQTTQFLTGLDVILAGLARQLEKG